MTTDDLLTSKQAGVLVGLSSRTIARYGDSGRLPIAVRAPGVNGARLFRRADVEALRAELVAELDAQRSALAAS